MLKVVGPSHFFDYYLNDPTTPSLITRVPLPKISESPLKLEVIGFKEGPLVQEDMVRIQAASVLFSILFTMKWVNKIKRIEKWAVADTLKVSPRAGKQLNAYYDRYNISFFYETHPLTKKVVFTSDSTEAVNHEFGHAILDSFRPDLWDLSNFEIFSFHESCGDIVSMLSSLHHDLVIEHIINETGNDLAKSNVVSRVAEEFGNTIFYKNPGSGRPQNCLRDASEPFEYVVPDSLPTNCSFSVLCREAHNFSRVFSSAWYKLFVEIRNRYCKEGKAESIMAARDVMARLSILCLDKIEKRKDFFCSVAESLLKTDQEHYNGNHSDLIRRVFTLRNILPNKILY
jgi:hypothetical protein